MNFPLRFNATAEGVNFTGFICVKDDSTSIGRLSITAGMLNIYVTRLDTMDISLNRAILIGTGKIDGVDHIAHLSMEIIDGVIMVAIDVINMAGDTLYSMTGPCSQDSICIIL